MTTAKKIEFVCVHCWGSFEENADKIAPGQEVIACPKCGEDVPVPPEGFDAEEDVNSPGDEAPPVPGTMEAAGAASPGEDQGSDDVSVDEEQQEEDDSGEGVTAEASETESEADANSTTGDNRDFKTDIFEGEDEEQAMWKLEIPGGLTYNFHGLRALIKWSEGKRDLSGVRVQVNDSDFKNLGHFLSLVADGLGVSEAFLTAVDGDREQPDEDDPEEMSTFSSDLLGEGASEEPSLSDLENDLGTSGSSIQVSEDVKERMPLSTDRVRGSVSGQFTFNVNQSTGSDGLARFAWCVAGIVLGLGLGAVMHKIEWWSKIFP
jgi:DNA-directed RNA polymerase subunit RPC12/RpoP